MFTLNVNGERLPDSRCFDTIDGIQTLNEQNDMGVFNIILRPKEYNGYTYIDKSRNVEAICIDRYRAIEYCGVVMVQYKHLHSKEVSLAFTTFDSFYNHLIRGLACEMYIDRDILYTMRDRFGIVYAPRKLLNRRWIHYKAPYHYNTKEFLG